MRKFERYFPFADQEDRYLIPELPDQQQPAAAGEFELAQCRNFQYHYPVLPEDWRPRLSCAAMPERQQTGLAQQRRRH
jgi:internalin A